MHVITATNASDDLVYNVTKLLYDNRIGVVEKHAAGRSINPDNVVRDTGTEFHPGAIRFLSRERALAGVTASSDRPATDFRQLTTSGLGITLCIFTPSRGQLPAPRTAEPACRFALLGLVLCFLNVPIHPTLRLTRAPAS